MPRKMGQTYFKNLIKNMQVDYEKQFEIKMNQLIKLGLRYDPSQNSYLKDDINVSVVEMKTMSDYDFDTLVERLEKITKERNGKKN